MTIFDQFEGEKIAPNNKAIAIEVQIQSNEKTLKEQEIQDLSKNIINQVLKVFKAKLR